MIGRRTPLTLSMLTLVAWGLFLGVLTGRAELLLATAPFLAALAWSALASMPGDWSVTHAVAAERVLEGEHVRVTVTLSAQRPVPLVELLERLPGTARVAAGRTHAAFALSAGEDIEWRYEIECVRRGRLVLGALDARVWDRLGLRALDVEWRAPKAVRVYPRGLPLRRLPAPFSTQTFAGDYVARAAGEGLEPADIRRFVAGDRVRNVNWRASLRHGTLYVTQYHPERNADVVLMLDTLAESGAAPATTLDLCARAVASLAAAYLGRKDRVGFIEYGGTVRWVKPASGRIQHERVLDALLQVAVTPTFVTKDLALVPPRVLPPQALVIAVSALLDPRFERAALDLAARGFDVVLIAVSPLAVTRAAHVSLVVDIASRLWALERRVALAALRSAGLTVVEWDPPAPLEVALARMGRRRRRLTRLA